VSKRVDQPNAPWGLARISGRAKIASRPLTEQNTYHFDPQGGSGTVGYVVDTGIYTQHTEFGGRASWGTSFVPSDTPVDCSGLNIILNPLQCLFDPAQGSGMVYVDDNGHGTHCAGTLGGTSVGVAKQAKLVAVKVLNGGGSGSTSDIIAALDWGAFLSF